MGYNSTRGYTEDIPMVKGRVRSFERARKCGVRWKKGQDKHSHQVERRKKESGREVIEREGEGGKGREGEGRGGKGRKREGEGKERSPTRLSSRMGPEIDGSSRGFRQGGRTKTKAE